MIKTARPSNHRVRFAIDEDNEDDDSNSCTTSTGISTKTTTRPLHSQYALTQDLCNDLWYQNHELNVMKSDTRSLILYGRRTCQQQQDDDDDDDDDDDRTGLERFEMDRHRYKKECIKYVMDVHSILSKVGDKDADVVLGDAARNSSSWASKVASYQGYQTFVSVYNQEQEPTNANNKRRFEHDDGDITTTSSSSRRVVRQRTQ